MAKVKKTKKPVKKESTTNKNEKLQVNGSFMDIMKAAALDANNKSAKKKS